MVEVGEVQYLPESLPAPQIPGTGYGAKSPPKGKRKRSETPAPIVITFEDVSVVYPK